MTDSRPRPEYGEYATPEQQAAATGTVSEALQEITPAAVVKPAPAGPQRRWDLVLTVSFIAIGTYVTFASLTPYANLASTLSQAYGASGYDGSFPDPSLASTIGIVMNVVQCVALVVAFWFSARSLRAGRISFWIPLLAGVVVLIVTVALFGVIVASDPAFIEFMTETVEQR